jgi:hypothetical protein
LTVATIIVASTIGIYDQAQLALRTNQTIVSVGVMSTGVRALHAQVGRYGSGGGVETNLIGVIANSNLIPNGFNIVYDAVTDIYTVRTPFGGQVNLRSAAASDGQSFYIQVEELANDVCVNIVTQSIAGGYKGLESVRVNSEVFVRGKGAGVETLGGSKTYPIPPDEAVQFCNIEAGNIIRWNYT